MPKAGAVPDAVKIVFYRDHDKKEATDWIIEGPREVKQLSVINQNHYKVVVKPAVISPIEGKMEIK